AWSATVLHDCLVEQWCSHKDCRRRMRLKSSFELLASETILKKTHSIPLTLLRIVPLIHPQSFLV
ncbi:unnamed protein product, partial [Amoebophrya sp. A25]